MTAGQEPADLSVAARCGDEEAFRQLYREVQPGLLRYLRGLVGEDAEDLALETWLQIARDMRSFRDEGTGFRGWAATIARHRALNHQQRPQLGPPIDELADLPDVQDTTEQVISLAATNATIAFTATLPKDQAEAVLLRVVMCLDAKAAAKVMGKNPGAVRTAAWRGLRTRANRMAVTNVSAGTYAPGTDPHEPLAAVLRAATAPGHPEELRGEHAAVAALLTAAPNRNRQSLLTRVLTVKALVIGATVASTGVVLATTGGVLPTPQPVGNPAPPVSVLAVAGPWAVAAVVALVVLLLGFVVLVVRSAKTNMSVRIGKIIDIQRGELDPPTSSEPPQLRSVEKPKPDGGSSKRSD